MKILIDSDGCVLVPAFYTTQEELKIKTEPREYFKDPLSPIVHVLGSDQLELFIKRPIKSIVVKDGGHYH